MNSLHYGLPQSRPRVYVIGMQKEVRKFKWPSQVPSPSLESILDQDQASCKSVEWPASKTEVHNTELNKVIQGKCLVFSAHNI